jgi:hypothetical protein
MSLGLTLSEQAHARVRHFVKSRFKSISPLVHIEAKIRSFYKDDQVQGNNIVLGLARSEHAQVGVQRRKEGQGDNMSVSKE